MHTHAASTDLTRQPTNSHQVTITYWATARCTTLRHTIQAYTTLWFRATRCGLSLSISPRCLARGAQQTYRLAYTPRLGTTAGATTPTHSTTRGGDIHATRGTTGTGTSATTLGTMTGIGATLHTHTTTITTTTTQDTAQDTAHHVHLSTAQQWALVAAPTTVT